VCIIGHGSSNDRAIFNGIRVAYEFAKAGTNERIEHEFASRPQRVVTGSASSPDASAASADPASSPDATVQ
jgi:glycerol-3-phosphate acyltransferase PlsX